MSYDAVKKSMSAGTPHELICAACPWDRLCIQPPSMTSAEVEQHMADAEAKDAAKATEGGQGMPMVTLMTALAYAGKDTAAQICPVFAVRLRGPEGRQIADGVRKSMREAGEQS